MPDVLRFFCCLLKSCECSISHEKRASLCSVKVMLPLGVLYLGWSIAHFTAFIDLQSHESEEKYIAHQHEMPGAERASCPPSLPRCLYAAAAASDAVLSPKGQTLERKSLLLLTPTTLIVCLQGLLPRLMRIPPGQAIVWAVSDQVTGFLERRALEKMA